MIGTKKGRHQILFHLMAAFSAVRKEHKRKGVTSRFYPYTHKLLTVHKNFAQQRIRQTANGLHHYEPTKARPPSDYLTSDLDLYRLYKP